MSSIGIDFVLRARTALFTQGLAGANNALKDFKKSARELDLGGGIKQLVGVGGVIAAFKTAIDNARELRDEADKTGKEIDSAIRSVANYGDALSKIFQGGKDALTKGLSFFTQLGDAARHYFQNVTEEQERAAQKMVVQTEKAALEAEKRLAASREANSPEKVAAAREKADASERSSMAKGTSEQKKLVDLINERADLEEKISKTPKGTTKYQELRDAISQNQKATEEATEDFDKRDAEREMNRRRGSDEAMRAAQDAEDKVNKAKKDLVEKFAPTVEQLAKQETGGFVAGNDPRLLARQALKEEDKARMLFERGDYKGGLAAAQKAQGIRKGLEQQTSESGALTPKAAEDAFTNALKGTNEEIEDLKKAVQGIIKAQK